MQSLMVSCRVMRLCCCILIFLSMSMTMSTNAFSVVETSTPQSSSLSSNVIRSASAAVGRDNNRNENRSLFRKNTTNGHTSSTVKALSTTGTSRRLSNWALFLNLLKHCPPGPLGHHCREHEHDGVGNGDGNGDGSSGSNGSSGSGSSGYSGNGQNGQNGQNNVNGSNNNNAVMDDPNNNNTSAVSAFIHSTTGQIILISVSAAAASLAILAMFVSNRARNLSRANHPLRGILVKRINLFQRMAQRSTNAAACRPESKVPIDFDPSDYVNTNEAGKTPGATDYRLA